MMYPFNYLFKSASVSFVYTSSINLFIGVGTITVSTVLQQLIDQKVDVNALADFLKSLFIFLFPHYCLGQGLLDMSIVYHTDEVKKTYGYKPNSSLFKYENIGQNIIFMFLQGIFFFTLNLFIEYNFFRKTKSTNIDVENFIATDENSLDEDVVAEKNRILNEEIRSSKKHEIEELDDVVAHKEIGTDFVKFVNLKKNYKKNRTLSVAVNSVSLGINKGECFGLIGFNGAGKTTIFKMMTGQIPISSGEIYVNGHRGSREVDKIHENIGYCPQTNALIPLLTCEEHLIMFARLRGIPEKYVTPISKLALDRFGLSAFSNFITESKC